MRSADGALVELHQHIMAAASGAAPWKQFLASLADVTGHTLGIVYHEDFRLNQTQLSDVINGDPELTRRYEEYYQHLNPYFRNPRARRIPAGTCALLDDFVPRVEVERTEFFQDFVRPQDVTLDGALSVVVFNDGRICGTSMTLCRRRNQKGMSAAESVRYVAQLSPHLRTAFRLRKQIDALNLGAHNLRSTLDWLPLGVILLDARGRVREANEAARRLAEQRDGFHMREDGLEAATAQDTARLRKVIGQTARTVLGHTGSPGGLLRLPRTSPNPEYEVLVSGLPAAANASKSGEPCVVVFVSDPAASSVPMTDALRALYGLSANQARVVMLLATGATLAQIADELEVTRETAKTHLKGAFLKTSTSRQSALVRLVLSSPAALRPPTLPTKIGRFF